MAQTGFTPLLIYSSSTATNAPTAGNLLNNATGSELAINIADGKLFYKDSSNAVQVIGWKIRPATAGGTGLTSFAVGDLIYADTTITLAKLADVATGNALISGGVGVAPSYGKIGLTTHVSGTLPTTNGGTGLSSFTANRVLYTSSTSAIGQSSALTFDGTTLTATGGGSSTNPVTIIRNTDPTGNGLVVTNSINDFSSSLILINATAGVNATNGSYFKITDSSSNVLARIYGSGLAIAGNATTQATVATGYAMQVNGGRIGYTGTSGSSFTGSAVGSIASGSSGTVSASLGGGVSIVSGGIAFNNFQDVVVWNSSGTTSVLGSASYGSPSTRSYSTSGSNLVLAIANNNNTGTYSITTTNLGG